MDKSAAQRTLHSPPGHLRLKTREGFFPRKGHIRRFLREAPGKVFRLAPALSSVFWGDLSGKLARDAERPVIRDDDK